jgi:type IV secretion system protein VirB3
MTQGKLEADKLFKGLTRPTMVLGVSFPFFLLNSFANLTFFIWASDLRIFLLAFIFHGIGYILCYDEPLFLELIIKKFQKCSFCKNKLFYQGDSYDLE